MLIEVAVALVGVAGVVVAVAVAVAVVIVAVVGAVAAVAVIGVLVVAVLVMDIMPCSISNFAHRIQAGKSFANVLGTTPGRTRSGTACVCLRAASWTEKPASSRL